MPRSPDALKLHAWAPDENHVVRSLSFSSDAGRESVPAQAVTPNRNGGFPEPPQAEPARLVAAVHSACGGETGVRLPRFLPTRAVRQVVCAQCQVDFEPSHVIDRGLVGLKAPAPELARPVKPIHAPALALPSTPSISLPALAMPSLRALPLIPEIPGWMRDPQSPPWRIGGAVMAAIAVIGILTLLQGDNAPNLPAPTVEATVAAAGAAPEPVAGDAVAARKNGSAVFVSESLYALALPAGWQRINPVDGASFSATAAGGNADATLWIERDPKLSLTEFQERSLEQLGQLAPGARIAEQSVAPTTEASLTKLAAPAPAGEPSYEVVLRIDGPYRYYLATTVMPDAPAIARANVDLIQNSLTTAGGNG